MPQGENAKEDLQGKKSLSEKVSLYRGDITLLEVDAIVNAGEEESRQACIEFGAEDGKAPLPSKKGSSQELGSPS
ncbi:ADP-ribose glycohydrolase MACROD2 [Grus japonensis]|uniref:ADP-ribose glycohydrolase MACROD2 n=1 Tax=Grus japonensis TaxID=30415 RepID=A0ABC9WQL5_GRUJA